MVTTLANFPPEVFAILSFFLPYESLENLWMVNNRRIIAVMSKLRGCLQLTCEATTKNPHWPVLVRHLQTLTSLTITSRMTASNAKARLITPTPDQLKALPPTLLSLRFNFQQAESCWCSNSKDVIDMASLLPSLQRLQLAGASEWTDSMVKILPPSLTLLFLEQNDKLTDDCVVNLPVNLSHLWLPVNSKLLKIGDTLPNLVSLRLSGGFSLGGRNLSDMLPKGLFELELPSNKSLTSEDVKKLPPKLTKLNLQLNTLIAPSCFSSFPSTLQALNISSQVEDTHIRLLPANMVALALNNCQELTSESFGLLPRSLTHFTAWKAVQISDEAIGLLPKGLKHLYLEAPLTDLAATAFPTGLLTLKLREIDVGSQFMVLLNLPSLNRLELTGDNLLSHDLQNCPRTVRYLHLISSTGLNPDAIQFIPPNIRVLSFMSSSGFKNVKRTAFPPSLISFYSADCTFLPEIF